MLFLLFELDGDRYALPARDVVEVLPLVALKQIPGAPSGVAGVMDYRGHAVPVLDLSALVAGRPAARRVSTRLFVIRASNAGEPMLGLIGERATEMLRRDDADFQPAGVRPARTRFLGPVTSDDRGLIQRIEVPELVAEGRRQHLWADDIAV